MLLPAEAIYAGNWSGTEPAPDEFDDFELMRGMGWSWADLEGTPIYVRQYCRDLLALRNQAEANDREKGASGG